MFLSIYVHFGNLEINRSKYFPFNRINFSTAAEVEKHLSSWKQTLKQKVLVLNNRSGLLYFASAP